MKRVLLAVLFLAGCGSVPPAIAAEDGLRISEAWARPTIPTRPGAGYFTLVNTGDEPDVLLGAESGRAEEIEIHMVEEQLGVANMLRLESLELEPGEEVVFEPGGMHLMFRGLAEPLAEGEEFPATLIFERAGEVEVNFTVGAEPSAGEDDGGDGRSG